MRIMRTSSVDFGAPNCRSSNFLMRCSRPCTTPWSRLTSSSTTPILAAVSSARGSGLAGGRWSGRLEALSYMNRKRNERRPKIFQARHSMTLKHGFRPGVKLALSLVIAGRKEPGRPSCSGEAFVYFRACCGAATPSFGGFGWAVGRCKGSFSARPPPKNASIPLYFPASLAVRKHQLPGEPHCLGYGVWRII